MAEPPKKQKKLNQSEMCGLTQGYIDWYQSHPPYYKEIYITYITKKRVYKENSLPKNLLSQMVWQKHWYRYGRNKRVSFSVLPVEVREKNEDRGGSSFDSKKMKFELTTTGNKVIGEFWYAFCKIRQKSEQWFDTETSTM